MLKGNIKECCLIIVGFREAEYSSSAMSRAEVNHSFGLLTRSLVARYLDRNNSDECVSSDYRLIYIFSFLCFTGGLRPSKVPTLTRCMHKTTHGMLHYGLRGST